MSVTSNGNDAATHGAVRQRNGGLAEAVVDDVVVDHIVERVRLADSLVLDQGQLHVVVQGQPQRIRCHRWEVHRGEYHLLVQAVGEHRCQRQ